MTCRVTDFRCLPLGSAQRISRVFSEGLGGREIHWLSGAVAVLLHGPQPCPPDMPAPQGRPAPP